MNIFNLVRILPFFVDFLVWGKSLSKNHRKWETWKLLKWEFQNAWVKSLTFPVDSQICISRMKVHDNDNELMPELIVIKLDKED